MSRTKKNFEDFMDIFKDLYSISGMTKEEPLKAHCTYIPGSKKRLSKNIVRLGIRECKEPLVTPPQNSELDGIQFQICSSMPSLKATYEKFSLNKFPFSDKGECFRNF